VPVKEGTILFSGPMVAVVSRRRRGRKAGHMKLKNERTGDVIELPPPNALGQGVVKFNERIVERCLYSDENETVTLADGRTFHAGSEWAAFIVNQCDSGAYSEEKP